MVQNSDASGQILFYTPLVLATALGIDSAAITTVSLAAYEPATFDGDASQILTLWLGHIPTQYVDALQAMISAANSPLYSQSGIQAQVANAINPTFDVKAYTSTLLATQNSDTSSTSTTSADSGKKSKTIIIAVVVTFGIVILALAGYAAFRATKRGALSLPSGGREERLDPQHRAFSLSQGGRLQLRDSTSSASSGSSRSTGFSGGSRDAQRDSHARTTSVDVGNDRRSSWWRFSAGSGGLERSGSTGQGDMREHRRVNVVRGPNGQFDIGPCVPFSRRAEGDGC